jgi:CheY-like chemotaxis protein
VSRKRLLCIDDDPETLKVRKVLLEASGYSVLTSTTASEGLRILAQGEPIDLVLLDYLMPEMNGDLLAVTIRRLYQDLPLLAVSAIGQLPPAFLSAVDANVQKGQAPEILLSAIAGLLARPPSSLQPDQSPTPPTVLCVDDEQLELKFRKMLFESAGYRVLTARSASAALEEFRSAHVDAVVMDYWLSGQNGTATAEEMKRMRPKTPIIMLSGYASLPGEGAVVDSWMRKADIEPEDLISEVNRLIQLRNPRLTNQKSE